MHGQQNIKIMCFVSSTSVH